MSKLFCSPTRKGIYSEGKINASPRSNCFHVREYSFLDGHLCTCKQTGSHKSCFYCQKKKQKKKKKKKQQKKKNEALQSLHHAPPLHLHQTSAITLSKIKSKGSCISLFLNIIPINACTCVNFD